MHRQEHSRFRLEPEPVPVHMSIGRYICGEETALLNALEGKRGNPRSKPPFPQISGLWGKPTIVNNVETLSNLPHIINNGTDWYKKLSRTPNGGTKLYGVSGKVKRPGLWELPLGVDHRRDHGRGLRRRDARWARTCARSSPAVPRPTSSDREHLDTAQMRLQTPSARPAAAWAPAP
jgi:NADH:ubiquinone oxidoreductase subunit F (NADH-binding)